MIDERVRKAIEQAIMNEPELPGDPPTAFPILWGIDAVGLLRSTVRATKQSILTRVQQILDDADWGDPTK